MPPGGNKEGSAHLGVGGTRHGLEGFELPDLDSGRARKNIGGLPHELGGGEERQSRWEAKGGAIELTLALSTSARAAMTLDSAGGAR